MAWLLRRGEVLASLDQSGSTRDRLRGLAGRDDPVAALLINPARAAHTLGARCRIDVAWLDEEYVVQKTTQLAPFRVALRCRGAHAVLEANAGAFDRWGLRAGDQLEVKD